MFTRNYAERESGNRLSERYGRSLPKVGRAGAGRADWIFQAIEELRGDNLAERIGVWLEDLGTVGETGTGSTMFRGEVWEKEIGNGVLEWTRLTPGPPLPMEMLKAGLSCEYEVGEKEEGAILGPELQLRRVLWVPVMVRRTLRGLVMEGTLDAKRSLPCAKAERAAKQLEILLELEEERRLATSRKADLDFWLRIKRLLAEEQSTNMILGQVTESCARGESMGGVGAVFSLIGEWTEGTPVTNLSYTRNDNHLLVRAQSGDAAWEHSVNGGPLESLWRQAVEKRRLAVGQAGPLPSAKEISRIVAIPVEVNNEIAGVLLAGLPRRRAGLEALDRLQWRAALAAEVLQREQHMHAEVQAQHWRKALLESSEEAAVLLDRQGTIVGISSSAEELLQNENVDSIVNPEGTPLAELFLRGQVEGVRNWLKNGVEKESEERTEFTLRGGTVVALKRLPISGREFSAVGFERVQSQRTERPLKETCEALQQAIEWLEEGVVVFDESDRILAQNSMFLKLLGVSESEGKKLFHLADVIGVASRNVTDPKLFAASWRTLAKTCTEGTQEELTMEKPLARSIKRYARPIVDPSGKIVGRVEVYRGTTGWRAFQTKMAQVEGLASLGQRVTRIVHELNNPLTTILGNAQRMVKQENGENHSVEAGQILQEAERATGIMRQLLDLPRETRPEMQLLSLNELVGSMIELERASLADSAVGLETELEEKLPRVMGDRCQLRQVLLNLLQNACQAMQESGTGTSLIVRTAVREPGKVILEVQDDGPGIPEAIQERIFDPFFTTKPLGKGTGLGLAIASGFVRQSGGTISVFSSPSGGARFVVEFPAAEEVLQVGNNRSIASLPAALGDERNIVEPGAEKRPRILVVEDEPTVAALIADVLREEGMEVDVAPDGRSALECMRQVSYDLVICDVNMPTMDGQLFFQSLQEQRSPLRERVLFVSGDEVAARTQEFLAQHQLPHVAKPFRVEELCLAVRSLLWGTLQAAGAWSERIVKDDLGTGRTHGGKQ